MPRIRIVDTPDGRAPLSVREAWVGCELDAVGPSDWPARGVVSGESLGEVHGFSVLMVPAIAVLREKDAEAASWFEANAGSLPGFIFREEHCELVPDVARVSREAMDAEVNEKLRHARIEAESIRAGLQPHDITSWANLLLRLEGALKRARLAASILGGVDLDAFDRSLR